MRCSSPAADADRSVGKQRNLMPRLSLNGRQHAADVTGKSRRGGHPTHAGGRVTLFLLLSSRDVMLSESMQPPTLG